MSGMVPKEKIIDYVSDIQSMVKRLEQLGETTTDSAQVAYLLGGLPKTPFYAALCTKAALDYPNKPYEVAELLITGAETSGMFSGEQEDRSFVPAAQAF